MAKPKATQETPTTSVARAKIALPANSADIMQQRIAALAGKLAAPTGKSISVTQSKQFRFPDGNTVNSFKGIIIDFVSYNAYYENDFDPKSIVPPNCFAIGVAQNDLLERSDNSPDPQPEDADDKSCKSCWANQWNSATKGKGKACKNSIKLAILCEDGEVRPMNISATAMKAFGEYVRNVVQAFGTAPLGVLTEFSMDPAVDYSSVRCGNPLKLGDDQLAEVLSRLDSAEAMIRAEPDTAEFEEKVVALRVKSKAVKSKRA